MASVGPFLQLDEAVASRAAFVIVSGVDGQKRFWSQLNISKTVRDRLYVTMGVNRNPRAGHQMGRSPTCRPILHNLATIHNAANRQSNRKRPPML